MAVVSVVNGWKCEGCGVTRNEAPEVWIDCTCSPKPAEQSIRIEVSPQMREVLIAITEASKADAARRTEPKKVGAGTAMAYLREWSGFHSISRDKESDDPGFIYFIGRIKYGQDMGHYAIRVQRESESDGYVNFSRRPFGSSEEWDAFDALDMYDTETNAL